MQRPALYFPYIHVRDDDWLKAAVLYWPSIGRIVPSGYAKHDSRTAAVFEAEGILTDVLPGGLVDRSAWDFLQTLRANLSTIAARYAVSGKDPSQPGDLAWIHFKKFPSELLDLMVENNVAVRGRGEAHDLGHQVLHGNMGSHWNSGTKPWDWVGLHPALAGAYMTALAAQISEREFYEPLTDQTDLRVATPNADVRDALTLLLGQPGPGDSGHSTDATETYVMLALGQVLPADLGRLEPEMIISCRNKLLEELTTFRSYVESMQSDLIELVNIPNETRRIEEFTRHVETTIEQPLAKLERGLKLLKIPSTRAVLTASALTPPALLGGEHFVSASPIAASTAGAVALVGSAWWAVSETRSAARQASPVGYLLDVRDELTPKTALSRARRIVAGTYG